MHTSSAQFISWSHFKQLAAINFFNAITNNLFIMTKPYRPPYTITPKIIRLISEASEQLGRLTALFDIEEGEKNLKLRRINRIRTIQGSLAIEGNTLSEEQITAILDGKRVIAPPKEIQEARNAIKAYE